MTLCMHCAGTGYLCGLNGAGRKCPVGCQPPPVGNFSGGPGTPVNPDRLAAVIRLVTAAGPPGVSSYEVAGRLGRTVAAVKMVLHELKQADRIEIGRTVGNLAYYRLTPAPAGR